MSTLTISRDGSSNAAPAANTLCEKCNNDTGLWYVPAFTRQQAMRFVIGTRGRPTLKYPFNLFPLRVLKQVICMFFSVNGTYFQKAHPDLVRFILNKESRDLPERVRLYAFYTFSNCSRVAGVTGVAKGSVPGIQPFTRSRKSPSRPSALC